MRDFKSDRFADKAKQKWSTLSPVSFVSSVFLSAKIEEGRQRVKCRRMVRKYRLIGESVLRNWTTASLMIFEHFTGTEKRNTVSRARHLGRDNLSKKYSE